MFSFQTAVGTCVSGFLLSDMQDDSDVKDKADEFAQLVQSVIDNPEVVVLPHAQVDSLPRSKRRMQLCRLGALPLTLGHRQPTSRRSGLSLKSFAKTSIDAKQTWTHTPAVAGLVAKEEAKSQISDKKAKKAKSGQVWRMFGKLERDGVPKFLAKVTLSPLASLYYITLLYYCTLLYDYFTV